jgi:ribonuclease HII
LLQFERKLWNQGVVRLAGVDEAGRGPLAGPVVAAAVVMDRQGAETEEHGLLEGLTDSKQLTAPARETFFAILTRTPFIQVGVGLADVDEIERVNILRATHSAMARAVASLPVPPAHLLVDGLPVPGLPCPSTPIVRGDAKSLLIAAASVVAKVVRDALMSSLDGQYPQYGFGRHKGYGTPEHVQALMEHGPCPAHRRTFRPVREAMELRARAGAGSGDLLLPLE